QRRGRLAVLLAGDSVAAEGDAPVEVVRARGDHHVRVERPVRAHPRPRAAAGGAPGVLRLPRLPRHVSRLPGGDPARRPARDEPRARARGPAADGPDLRVGRPDGVVTSHFDLVIIGSGAGGGTLAQALAGSGAKILVVERGDYIPQEEENWSPEAVWRDLRYRADDW